MKLLPFLILLSFTAFGQNARHAAPSIYGSNPQAGHYVTLRGFRMYYEVYGKGAPLLMLHGNGGSIASFKKQIPYFSAHYRVIAPDSRAQGKSTDPGDSLGYAMMADDFDSLLNYLHIDSCYVLGWSDGGIDALLLAIRHPGKVKKLAVTGANLYPDSTAFGSNEYKLLIDEDQRLHKLATDAAGRQAYKLFHIMAVQPLLTPPDLKQVHCPSLIIGGDHDVILPQHTMLIAQSIPGAFLWILPDSGHDTLIKYSNEFNRKVNWFFSLKQ